MAKKFVLVGIALMVVAGAFFIMMRRSHMMSTDSQVPAGGLKAVNAQGAEIPLPASQPVIGQLPENTALQESDGLLVTLSMEPYPPKSGAASYFIVGVSDTSGRPVSDATVSLDLTMPSMWMPPNQVNLSTGKPGVYQSNGYFTMRGLWRIEVIITRGGQKQSVFFDVGL